MKQKSNEHITKFLKYYIGLSSPEYAILLDGKWGSGKTHFIDNFIKNNKFDKFKFIKISLFGMRETSEIDEELFQQIHPILGNKYVKFVGNIAKGALKIGVNLDFDGNGSSEGKVTIDPKAFTMLNDDKEGKELVFVFDDLARTDIEITKALGYINSLVELSKQKVIILASEKKLIDRDEKEDYKEFKEKVIGKTFEIKQDFDSAFDSFLILAENSKRVLKNNKKIIADVFEVAGYKNLRHIRQSILDFEHLFENIDGKYIKHSKLMEDLIREFFACSIEFKHGKLEKQSIVKEYDKHCIFNEKRFVEATKAYQTPYDDKNEDREEHTIFNKYSFLKYNTQIVQNSLWDIFFKQGTLEKESLSVSFDKSSYFSDEAKEDWVKLYHFRHLENDEFKPLLKKVIDKFEKGDCCKQTTLLHIGALLIFFSKEELYDKSLEEVKKKVRKVIDNCRKNKQWKEQEYKKSFQNGTGLGFMGSDDSKDFQEIEDYLITKNKESIMYSLSEIGKEILEILQQQKEDIDEDLSDKLFSRNHKPPLSTLPIFSTIKPQDFLDVILSIKHKEFIYIMDTISERYNGNTYHKGINSDLDFWEEFNKLLKHELGKYKGTVKGYLIKYTIKRIDEEIINSIKHRGDYNDD